MAGKNSHLGQEAIRSKAKKVFGSYTYTSIGPFWAVLSGEFSIPATRISRERAGKVAGLPARPAAGRTDCPCSSRRRHFAALAQIIRVNLDAKMAGVSIAGEPSAVVTESGRYFR
jgi:hypothetical protein